MFLAACTAPGGGAGAPPAASATPAAAAATKPVPVIVDNHDPEGRFTIQGNWHQAEAGGDWGGNLCHWSMKDPDGGALARWETPLPASGRWKVYVWYGSDPYDDHATDAPFTVDHADGETTVPVNEKQNQQTWVWIGTYRFDAGVPAIVTVSNRADGNVIADAVKFAPE
jgi:hypothetical protein